MNKYRVKSGGQVFELDSDGYSKDDDILAFYLENKVTAAFKTWDWCFKLQYQEIKDEIKKEE